MTVSNIDCDFDSRAQDEGGGTFVEDETGTTVVIRRDTAPSGPASADRRIQFRFPLSATITAGSTINDSDVQANKTAELVNAGEDIDVHAYNGDGIADPDTDTAANKYSRSAGGSTLVQLTGNGTGSVTADLGATADGHIQANISSPGFYSLGFDHDVDWDDTDSVTIEAIENAGTDPATLTVDWTAPAAGTLQVLMMMGVGT